jgi:hypothetical protein
MRDTFCILAAVSLLSALCIPALPAVVHGPSTMYAPSSARPKPGSLYPRALQLRHSNSQNGYMLATFEESAKGVPSFPIYRSTNGGLSWKLFSRVSDTQNGWGMRFQPFLYELPQSFASMPAGTVLCLGNSIPTDLSQTRLEMYKSLDRGATWSFVSHISRGGAANPDGTKDPVWEPFALLSNGKLIVYYSDERDPAHNQKIVHQTSVDGLTWSSVVDDVAIDLKQRPGMPVVAKMGNGRYIMALECVCDGTSYTAIKTSSDPEHWDAGEVGTIVSHTGGTPYVVWMPSGGPNGTLILSTYDHDEFFTNCSYGVPGSPWMPVGATVGNGYSRSLIVLLDDKTLFEISPVSQRSGYNNVEFGTQTIDDDLRGACIIPSIK